MAEEKKEMQRVSIDMFGLNSRLEPAAPARRSRRGGGGARRIKEMSRRVRSFDVKRIAALTVLQMMDEYDQLKHDYDELVQLLEEK